MAQQSSIERQVIHEGFTAALHHEEFYHNPYATNLTLGPLWEQGWRNGRLKVRNELNGNEENGG